MVVGGPVVFFFYNPDNANDMTDAKLTFLIEVQKNCI